MTIGKLEISCQPVSRSICDSEKARPADRHDNANNLIAARLWVAQPPFRERVEPLLEKLARGFGSPALPGRKVRCQELRDRRSGAPLYVPRQFDSDRIALRNDQENSCSVRLCLDECKKRIDCLAKPDLTARR